jgi:hypothetical protein
MQWQLTSALCNRKVRQLAANSGFSSSRLRSLTISCSVIVGAIPMSEIDLSEVYSWRRRAFPKSLLVSKLFDCCHIHIGNRCGSADLSSCDHVASRLTSRRAQREERLA